MAGASDAFVYQPGCFDPVGIEAIAAIDDEPSCHGAGEPIKTHIRVGGRIDEQHPMPA